MSTEKSPALAGQASTSSPTKRRALIGILLIVALCVAAWFLTSSLRNNEPEQVSTTTPNNASETATAEPTTTPEATSTTAPTTESTNEAAAAPTTQAPAPDTTEPTTQAPAPKADRTEDTKATPPSTTTADRAPLTGSAPLIQQLPAPASGGQTLVEGFPTDIMGPLDGTNVLENTVSVEGSTMQVSLTGRTTASPEEISRHYAELWASLGLSPQPGSDNGSLSATSDFDWASLTFNPASETGNEYTVYGFFRID